MGTWLGSIRNPDINLQRERFERVNTLKYLGVTLAENGDLDTCVDVA